MNNKARRLIKMSDSIKEKLDAYPIDACNRLIEIRALILEVADEEALGEITESLKWGEPSFTAKKGSPIRMDWKPKNPNQISVFFNCKTTLIETFKEIHQDTFQFVDTREIVLPLSQPVPMLELKACLSMALRYHDIKHLPLLGA